MSNKKKAAAATTGHEKTFMEKLGEKASHLKEELIAGKDHLLEAAGEKIESIKSTIQEYKAGKKIAKKKVAKKTLKPLRKKTASPNKKAPVTRKTKKTSSTKG